MHTSDQKCLPNGQFSWSCTVTNKQLIILYAFQGFFSAMENLLEPKITFLRANNYYLITRASGVTEMFAF